MKGSRLQKVWFFKKCLAVGIILLFNGFVYTSVVNADDTDDDLIFIHHSVGQNWLDNSLHDVLLAKDYIDERNDIYYNTDVLPDNGRPDSLAPTPGDYTNMNHWILWFNDYLEGVKNHGCADGFNKIIMFKSCYPISNIVDDGREPGNPFDAIYPSGQTIVNYKAVYRHPSGPGNTYSNGGYTYYPLEDVFAGNPDVLFIPVTAPPCHYAPNDATNDAEAHRARVFNNWLKNDWLENYTTETGLNNVAVFDWFDLLAYPDNHPDHPNRLKSEYGGESGDSHPNTLANQESTVDFATGSNNFIDTKWNAFINNPPFTPAKPSGRSVGTNNRLYTYTSTTTDVNGDQIYYRWDWSDEISDWIGPYDSDVLVEASHSWASGGLYNVRVKAKDIYGVESDWSESLSVRIFGVQVRKMEDPVVHPPIPHG